MSKTSDDRFLYLLKSKGSQTAGEIGGVLKMTAAGAQQRLARLAERGLVAGEERKQARGRPRKYWALTDRGHARFPDRHSDLTVELLRSTEAVFGPAGLEKLIRHREADTRETYLAAMKGCDSLEERVEALAALRSQEGYMADWSEPEPGVFVLVEHHCPICAAAETCQGLCRSELAIFGSVLGPGVLVERMEHILAGARRCSYRISETQ